MLDILNGKDYKIYPNFLDKEHYEELLTFVTYCSWKHQGYAANTDIKSDAKRFHPIYMGSSETHIKLKDTDLIALENYSSLPVGIQDVLNKFNNMFNKKFSPTQIYFNCFTHGDEMSFHRDNLSSAGNNNIHNVTFMLYLTKQWEPIWQGSTLFKEEHGPEILGGCLPYPNHLIVFDSRLLHVCAPISRFCPLKRNIFVCQTEYNDN